MSAVFNLLALRSAYRESAADEGFISASARQHLTAAGDALSLALLTLSSDDDPVTRAMQARSFLVEAVTALSRARIYVPGIKTHALPVVMSCERDTDAELARLHQIATRLLWQNHTLLPARLQAKPLEPEEEAELAVVMAGLHRNQKVSRALRFRWAAIGVVLGGAAAVAGFPVLAAATATAGVGLGIYRVVKDKQS